MLSPFRGERTLHRAPSRSCRGARVPARNLPARCPPKPCLGRPGSGGTQPHASRRGLPGPAPPLGAGPTAANRRERSRTLSGQARPLPRRPRPSWGRPSGERTGPPGHRVPWLLPCREKVLASLRAGPWFRPRRAPQRREGSSGQARGSARAEPRRDERGPPAGHAVPPAPSPAETRGDHLPAAASRRRGGWDSHPPDIRTVRSALRRGTEPEKGSSDGSPAALQASTQRREVLRLRPGARRHRAQRPAEESSRADPPRLFPLATDPKN